MKRLVPYLIISVMAALYSVQAEAAANGRRVSLSYEASFSLSIPAPGTYGAADTGILYLPAVTPAGLLNNDYEIILNASRPSVSLHAGLDVSAGRSGWKLVNTDPRFIKLQPTYFWSGKEIGVRANVWNADRFLVLTYKMRF